MTHGRLRQRVSQTPSTNMSEPTAIPLRKAAGSANAAADAVDIEHTPEAQGLLADSNGHHDEEDASWLEDEADVWSLKRERDRKRRARSYAARDRHAWMQSQPWYPLARFVFLAVLGCSALFLATFSIRSAWHTTTSHAPGAPASSSHPPKDKTRLADSLLPGNELSNGTHAWRRTVLLISIDGAKPKYLADAMMPRIAEMGKDSAESAGDGVNGVIAAYMQPRFPTLTFPNHWTLLTGLNTESHGIIANDFTIPAPAPPPSGSSGRHFLYTDPIRSHDGAWWKGLPLWAVAERAGVPSAVMHWPGPPRLSSGDRPSLFEEYNGKWTVAQREEKVHQWLSLPVKRRPQVMCVYIPTVDQAAHSHGPASSEAAEALGEVDNMIGRLRRAIHTQYNATHIIDVVIVSDHGMTKTDNSKLVYLDDLLSESLLNEIEAKDGWPSVGLHFKGSPERQAELLAKADKALRLTPLHGQAFDVYTRDKLPARWHWGGTPRVAPLWIVPRLPWSITSHEEMHGFGGKYEPIGQHGYDSSEPDMAALFVARGPSFKSIPSVKGPAVAGWHNMRGFDNLEVHSLVADIIGVPQSVRPPTNGTAGFWDAYLQK